MPEPRVAIAKIGKRLHQASPGVRWQAAKTTALMQGSWYIDEDVPEDYRRIIVSVGPDAEWILETPDPETDEVPYDRWWIHTSISRPHEMPSYDDLTILHAAVFGPTGWSYQVFAPRSEHVNIHAYALHLWGKPDGAKVLPNFGALGSI